MMTQPYQFAFHDRVSPTPPHLEMWERCLKIEEQPLTREEKDRIFGSIQNNNSGTGTYKLGGWAFPFRRFMKRFVVKHDYDTNSWTEIWAFDKMCIRNNTYTKSNIIEIQELPVTLKKEIA